MELDLGRGYKALLDEPDWNLVKGWRWNAQLQRYKKKVVKVYAQRSHWVNGKQTVLLMHRFILGLTDRKVEVDHINGIGTDNRRCNLRVTDRAGNARNCRRRVDNVSGYKGVYKDERNRFRPWIAQIKFKKKKYRLGYFATPQEAHKAYCEAAQKMHAEFANLGV